MEVKTLHTFTSKSIFFNMLNPIVLFVDFFICRMSTVKKSHVLNLGRSGRFAMSVVDNLIFVHHQASKVR